MKARSWNSFEIMTITIDLLQRNSRKNRLILESWLVLKLLQFWELILGHSQYLSHQADINFSSSIVKQLITFRRININKKNSLPKDAQISAWGVIILTEIFVEYDTAFPTLPSHHCLMWVPNSYWASTPLSFPLPLFKLKTQQIVF